MVKPGGYVVDMRHYIDEGTGDRLDTSSGSAHFAATTG
jgi:hypothetical protein